VFSMIPSVLSEDRPIDSPRQVNLHGYTDTQLIGNYEYSEVDDYLVESSTGTQLETLDSSDVKPLPRVCKLKPRTTT